MWIRLNAQQYCFKCFFFSISYSYTHLSRVQVIILGRENHHPSHPSNYFTSFYTQFYVYVLTFIIICVLQFLNTDTSLSWTILLFHNWTDFIQFLPPYLDRSWRFFCLSQSQSLAVVNNDVRLPFLISVIVASVTVYSIILLEMKYNVIVDFLQVPRGLKKVPYFTLSFDVPRPAFVDL